MNVLDKIRRLLHLSGSPNINEAESAAAVKLRQKRQGKGSDVRPVV